MSSTPTKRARRVSAETEQPETLEAVQSVVAIPLEKLHRHKDNRVITPESVADLVESLREHGQRDPLRVRPLVDPIGHFEILSGERRFVAAGIVPQETLRCIVETHSASQSLIELAVANAARVDLNPIERGELLEKLTMPEVDGGGGMERAAAGRLFGLNSESGVKNALRLVKLPAWIRELVASGKITVGKARPLCAYSDEVLEAFGQWLHTKERKWTLQNFLAPFDEGDADGEIDRFIRDETRPVDDQATFYKYQFGGDVRCLIELTEASRKLLRVVEIPNNLQKHQTPKGVKRTPTRLVALNVTEWDKQQTALLKAAQVAKAQKGAPKDSNGKPGQSKSPSAAELKARRTKADDQLKTYTRDWICLALRYQMSLIAESTIMPLLPSLLAKLYDRNLQAFNDWAFCELVDRSKASKKPENAAAELRDAIKGDVAEFYAKLWAVILWPSSKWTVGHDDMAAPGTIPERLPSLGTLQCHELAAACGVSMETVWAAAAKDSMQRSLVRRWLLRHNKEQLVALGKSLGVAIAEDKRDAMVEALLKEHQNTPQKKPLKLPALLVTAAGKKGGRQ